MPVLSDPAAWARATAASLAEISSSALNRSDTLYCCPRTSPATFGVTLVACRDAVTMASGFSNGISVMAVSSLIVLAGLQQAVRVLGREDLPRPGVGEHVR